MRNAVVCRRLIPILDFSFWGLFLNNHFVLVKELSVLIFRCSLFWLFFARKCNKGIVVSVGSYSFALCRIWLACSDCGL
jgi:hypothetical protein